MWFPCLATILALVTYAEGFGSGAPVGACQHMTPGHDVSSKPLPAPYVVTTSTKVVKAGTPMEVTISGKSAKDTIRGIMLQARAGDKIVGTFKVNSQDPFTVIKCNNEGDTVSHTSHEPERDVRTASFTWTPPADFNDNIKFRATIVRVYDEFWVGVESASVKVTL